MKIVLLKDVKGIGRRFEEKNVSDGHATNFLIPRGLAVAAGSPEAAKVLAESANEADSREKATEALEAEVAKAKGTALEAKMKASEQGHLFAALNKEKISEIISTQTGASIDPKVIMLKSPIKETGTYEVPVRVGEKETSLTLVVSAA